VAYGWKIEHYDARILAFFGVFWQTWGSRQNPIKSTAWSAVEMFDKL
jgi:hypothetical protein